MGIAQQGKATNLKCKALLRNGTWELMECPIDTTFVDYKWVYRTKFKSDDNLDKYKPRLVAKGYDQQNIVDYF